MDRTAELLALALKDPQVATWKRTRVEAICDYLARSERGERASLYEVLQEHGAHAYGAAYQQLKMVSRAVGVEKTTDGRGRWKR